MSFFLVALGAFTLTFCLQLFRTRYRPYLRSIPGPFVASFANLWKIVAVYHEAYPAWNIAVHKKYGPVVRIGPNHVSFSTPTAFQAIYTSRRAFPKSDFYEVGAPPAYLGEPFNNLFSLRDAQQHATLKRNIGGLYTKASVSDFQPNIDHCVDLFLKQIGTRTEHGPGVFDMSLWLHLFAFDALGGMNVSKPLGFLESGNDVEDMIGTYDKIFMMVGLVTQVPAIQWVFCRLMSLAPAEEWYPALKYTLREMELRKLSTSTQTDMLSRLLDLQDESLDKISTREITAAIFINLTAGHDVLAITLRAIWYYLARNDRVLKKLRAEIDHASKNQPAGSIISFSRVSSLPYLDAVIQETLRVHPNTGTIIERLTPQPGASIDDYYVPGGTIVGVNAWVLHRDEQVFGKDALEYRPERWIDASDAERLEMNRNLFSFGAGAHSCIGKNIAMMMITKVVFEFYRRYDAVLEYPEREWVVHGSWVTKQTNMDMVVRRI